MPASTWSSESCDELPAAREIDARIADIQPVEPVALDDRHRERGDHFRRVVAERAIRDAACD